jgi:hypothetical protein
MILSGSRTRETAEKIRAVRIPESAQGQDTAIAKRSSAAPYSGGIAKHALLWRKLREKRHAESILILSRNKRQFKEIFRSLMLSCI